MKAIFSIGLFAVLLTGCAEKAEYEEAVLQLMEEDKDIKDYQLNPEQMTACVVQTTAAKMPGALVFGPDRRQAYINYTKMLMLEKSEDPKKTLDELKEEFGSARALADARLNYAQSVYNCVTNLVSKTEEEMEK